MLSIDLPERAYCADVDFPMAVVGTASKGIIIYQLDGQPKEFKKVWWSIWQSDSSYQTNYETDKIDTDYTMVVVGTDSKGKIVYIP